jgi:hypothetical protein
MTTRGIPEVPLPQAKTIVDRDGKHHTVYELSPQHYQWMVQIRQMVINLTGNQSAMVPPTNFRVTGQGLSNLIQFTRASNADYYEMASSTTANLNDLHLIITDIGNSSSHPDTVGSSAITKFYWIRSCKNTGLKSVWNGPIKAATTTAGVAVPQATPPPPSNIIIIDQSNGNKLPYKLVK